MLEIISAHPVLTDPFKKLDNVREKRGLFDSLLFKGIVRLFFVALTGVFGAMTSHLFGHGLGGLGGLGGL